MRKLNLFAASLMILAGSSAFAAVKGDYVEVRTASVFAGPCHYNGELVTTGRDAIMAWNATSGDYKGIDLAGVRAVAVVSSDANLIEEKGARKSEIVIDASATEAQAKAMGEMLRERSAAALGEIVSVRRASVSFKRDGDTFTVDAAGIAKAVVSAMPNGECCKQPSNVWYTPLTQVAGQKVGYTTTASYAGGKVGDAWQRADENSAFYGTFER
jgi:hypothetical protein